MSKKLLVIGNSPGKGRGVFAKSTIRKGSFVCAYEGELLTSEEAERRGEEYDQAAADKQIASDGCYMFWFPHNGVTMCIDAGKDDGSFGRLINHSKAKANLEPRSNGGNKPGISFYATRQILKGEELFYDYDEDDPEALATFPWLKL